MRPSPRRSQAGMSLMEVMVALALLVAMVGLAVPYLGGIMGVDVRENARKLGSTIRSVGRPSSRSLIRWNR